MIRRNRNWVVLRLAGGAGSNIWVQFTAIYAPTARAAIDQATKGEDNPYSSGTFRAIPARAWGRPRTIDAPPS